MKEKLQSFMVGRYGSDDFTKFLLIVICVLCVFSLVLPINFLTFFILGGVIYSYYRMFSRNYNKRYAENVKYLQMKEKVLSSLRKNKNIVEEKKVNHIYTCPECKQKIRIPKGKGKVCITCPKCRNEFSKRS